jgi:uncharacterized membrane protein YeaQ/YmgE (transglycosylase-associated protein family)
MTITGIISALLIGLLVGILGRLLLPGRQNISILLTIIVGVIAAVIGTWLVPVIGLPAIGGGISGINWMLLLVQVVLAALGVAALAGVHGRWGRGSRLLR